MAIVGNTPDWEALKAAFESRNPDDEIIILCHNIVKVSGQPDNRIVHCMHNIPAFGERIAEGIINNAMRGQNVAPLLAALEAILLSSRAEIERLSNRSAAEN